MPSRQTEFWVAGTYQRESWKAVDKWINHGCWRPLQSAGCCLGIHSGSHWKRRFLPGSNTRFCSQNFGLIIKPTIILTPSTSSPPVLLLPAIVNVSEDLVCVFCYLFICFFFFFNCNWGLGTGNISLYPNGMNSPSFEILVLLLIKYRHDDDSSAD